MEREGQFVSLNDQGEVFLLGQIEQLACAGNGTRSVGVLWTNWPISSEMSQDADGTMVRSTGPV